MECCSHLTGPIKSYKLFFWFTKLHLTNLKEVGNTTFFHRFTWLLVTMHFLQGSGKFNITFKKFIKDIDMKNNMSDRKRKGTSHWKTKDSTSVPIQFGPQKTLQQAMSILRINC